MFSEPWFIKVSSTPLYLLGLFVLLLIILDLTLVRCLKLGSRTWKKLEYVWLGTAVLGLLSASGHAGRFVGLNYHKNTQEIVEGAYSGLREHLQLATDDILCKPFQDDDSEDREVREAFEELCASYRVLLAKMPAAMPNSEPSLSELGVVLPQSETRDIFWPYLESLEFFANHYEDVRLERKRWLGNTDQDTGVVSPRGQPSPLLIMQDVAEPIT